MDNSTHDFEQWYEYLCELEEAYNKPKPDRNDAMEAYNEGLDPEDTQRAIRLAEKLEIERKYTI